MCNKIILNIMKPPTPHGNIRFNYTLLEKYSTENNLVLLNDYKSIKNYINGDTLISAKCISHNCEGTFNKPFRYIFQNSALYCKSCSNSIRTNKIRKTIIENRNEFKYEERVKTTSSRRCAYKNCHKYPSYNFEGSQYRLYCFAHKSEDMVNVIKRPECGYPDCKIFPRFNIPKQHVGMFCSTHKSEDMIPVVRVHNVCKSKGCYKYINRDVNRKYNGFCSKCAKANIISKESIAEKESYALEVLVNGFLE